MTITTTGKNAIRDLINTNKDYGELGTDSTAPLETDTGLGTAVAATQQSLTSSTSDKQIVLAYELNSVTGNGNTYQEFQNTLSSGTNFNRVTFAGVQKTSAIEIQVNTTIFIK
jgi:hypothetical protein